MINLDFLCMKTAQEMMSCVGAAADKENVATKSLGVLLENGPYGLMLYLQTHAKDKIAACYRQKLIALCAENLVASYLSAAPPNAADFAAITGWLRDLAKDLDQYLLAKRLWQQTLTYARYHAKAIEEDTTGTRIAGG
jgi:hypothetical protein